MLFDISLGLNNPISMSATKPNNTSHSATSQMLGYLYQMERALHWLASSREDTYVFIETDDDIVVKLQGGNSIRQIFEQDKISTRQSNSFTDSSENLWKTMAIWIDIVVDSDLDISDCRFILSTNTKSPKSSSFVNKISKAASEDEADKIYKELLAYAKGRYSNAKKKTPTQTKMNPFHEKFIKCDESIAKGLVKNIHLIENLEFNNRKDYKDMMRHMLQCPNTIPLNVLYSHLLGWITDIAITSWINNKTCKIHNEVFYERYSQFTAKYVAKPYFERTIDSLPISDIERAGHKSSHFVKQIEAIDADDDECLEAINDFIRQTSQKTLLALEGNVSSSDFEEYELELKDFWLQKSRQFYRRSVGNDSEIGYDLFSECKMFKGKLRGVEPDQRHTSRGTYHKLSDSKELGWHPKWKTI